MFARSTIAPASRRAAAGLVLAIAVLGAFPAGAPAAACRAAQVVELGDRGPEVRAIQRTLARATYLPRAAVDGRFGWRTWHAVVAVQGWHALARDGIVGPRTRAALHHASRPVPWSAREGYEVHVAAQVLLMVRDGRVRRAIHVSAGAGSSTPLGHFRVERRERMSWSRTFGVWMPYVQYFWRGYAMHAYPIVLAYPASHGRVRVPSEEAEAVWNFGQLRMRMWIGG